MYVIIDNYDSFTYNLYQYFCEITDQPVKVFRNDAVGIRELEELNPSGIIISPGPGTPEEAGISIPVIKHFAGRVPILGVCLGHQSIGAAFGARIASAKRIVHGKAEEMTLDGRGLFRSIPKRSVFTRYHSLCVVKETLSRDFEITATADDGEIMGIRHKTFVLEGVQFHPESIASEHGKTLLKNFINYKREAFPVKEKLAKLMRAEHLSFEEAEGFMEELTDGNLNVSEMAGFLVALNMKGYTAQEIAGCASVLKRKKQRIVSDIPVVDTCGTGGDGLHTFNISSLAALVVAACGVGVAKHGNRAVSSSCGSADFYKELGISIDLAVKNAQQLLAKTHFSFLFAPLYHGAMKHAAPVRKDLGIKTIMNLLGPLANPAEAETQLIGVYAPDLCEKQAQAARMLGVKRVMVVHGLDGIDEISVSAPTRIVEIREDGKVKDYIFNPEDIGLPAYRLEELRGGTPQENARLGEAIINGEGSKAIRDAVLLNAGAALFIAGKAASIAEGFAKAREALERGLVRKKLEEVRRLSTDLKQSQGAGS
jgi:anthranilate synthase/phosphoribosyltransferase